jgi:hypothetical protein
MPMYNPDVGGKRPRPLNVGALPPDQPKTERPAKKKAAKKNATSTTSNTLAFARRTKLAWRARDQENSKLYNLQLDVAGLQSELQGLRAYHQLLMSRALNRHDDRDGSLTRTVQEYFRVFRFGYASDTELLHGQRRLALPQCSSRDSEDIATPDEFLRRVMDEHVWIGRFAGLTQMMKQWARYVSVFGPMTLSFLDSHIVPSFRGSRAGQELVLVISRAQYHLYISMRTLEVMFPHVLPHHDIVTRILGRRIRGIGKFHFVFDMSRKRVIQYWISLDLASSFTELLGDPAMVAVLLKDALITDEYFIGDLSEFVPDTPPEPSFCVVETELGNNDSVNQDASPGRPWKMEISNILSASGGDDNDFDACDRRD